MTEAPGKSTGAEPIGGGVFAIFSSLTSRPWAIDVAFAIGSGSGTTSAASGSSDITGIWPPPARDPANSAGNCGVGGTVRAKSFLEPESTTAAAGTNELYSSLVMFTGDISGNSWRANTA
jgi:hypothetical protein